MSISSARLPKDNTRFTGLERELVIHSLRVAADRFEENAKELRKGATLVAYRLIDQFERQAKETREIADRIENFSLLAVGSG
jgi:hypothetical protein